ncbi:beta-mannanase man5E [Alteromonas oceanisediminis]|uniref:beta-mannanase man5E n=1 Tax=Alteromonas oceanisediminis TaxID=2836180 RepID=UPI001BDA6786|nr:beta-mannanase man5E [Alteromonas oceanisediminis]MBT0586823.1 beta-mannanase man5E [Alteromonas oceanisediminis]
MGIRISLVLAALLIVTSGQVFSFDYFISRQGSQLYDGKKEFRFFGLHAPELHRIEDDARGTCKQDRRGWGQHFKWPTEDEQHNWIQALTRSGHTAMRIYVLSIEHPDDSACGRQTHINSPVIEGGMPQLNEQAMKVYDRMIALADKHNLRLILPFIDHWQWWGGRAELAAFYGETGADFYRTDSKTYKAYLHIIESVITRKNSLTGRHYFEEKAIMAWETGNELKDSTSEFVSATAAKIKSLAPNQLVVDGNYLSITPSSLIDENVDIISNHFYSVNGNNNPDTVEHDLGSIAGRKAYIVGEYGLLPTDKMKSIAEAIVSKEVAGHRAVGGFVWGFRGHRHDGGFYWHHEGDTGYQSYRLPGFPEAYQNKEIQVINLVRQMQASMQGLGYASPLPVPLSPLLRPIGECGEIRFMGAPLGRIYRIERRVSGSNVWRSLTTKLSDGQLEFDPKVNVLFKDAIADFDSNNYEYRIIAINESGESEPSNIQTWSAQGRCNSAT